MKFITGRMKLLPLAILICGTFVVLFKVLGGNNPNKPVEYFLENTIKEYEKDWPTEVLNVFEEPTFIPRPKDGNEQYRFLLLRSLVHQPVIIRIELASNGKAEVYAKEGRYALELIGGPFSGPPIKNVRTYKKILSEKEFSSFKGAFTSLNICKPSPEKSKMGMDGSIWLFEYRSSNVHCVQYVWTPEDEVKHSVAKLMISLANIPMSSIGPIY